MVIDIKEVIDTIYLYNLQVYTQWIQVWLFLCDTPNVFGILVIFTQTN